MRINITNPLRKYALAMEGSNSIALFASSTASAQTKVNEPNILLL